MKKLYSPFFTKLVNQSLADKSELTQGCSLSEIDVLQESATKMLNINIPEEFTDFLLSMNGYSDFGLMLYATKPILLKKSQSYIYGLIEQNTHFFQFFPGKIVLGEVDGELIVYDAAECIYENLDRISVTTNFKHNSFWKVLDEKITHFI